jgi:radical SAM superfamily enzyme YgiQ (UPF0313 family)
MSHTQSQERPLSVLLISTYELGHQPFGLASPAAWLRAAGCDVAGVDLAVESLDEASVRAADLIALHVPMHTATRLACELIPRLRALNSTAHLCAYGLYAPMNEDLLRGLGVSTVLGGEFEDPLVQLAKQVTQGDSAGAGPQSQSLPLISLGRQQFEIPDRNGLPGLSNYARLRWPGRADRLVGYTEATRGCKHLCRHCPIVPVYGGRFRVVQRDVVLADIDRQVADGAEHITFGDPDFFNAPGHAIDLVERLHARHPELSYDATIKVEHLVAHARLLPALARTGCLLVTSAVEAFDDQLLDVFDKRHSRADVVSAVQLLRSAGIALSPTFVAFTPWTRRETYLDFLTTIHGLGLVGNVSPIQYAIRLLVPQGSRLLEVGGSWLGKFDHARLCYQWAHPDPLMDELQEKALSIAEAAMTEEPPRSEVFRQICMCCADLFGGAASVRLRRLGRTAAAGEIPHLTEPWYCCAEPVGGQLKPLL